MKKIFAFTLAEVLLTMSIVGVVAAMTIPTLRYSHIKKEHTTSLKNFYSHMENAIMDMQMDKGSYRDLRYDKSTSTINGKSLTSWYEEYIDPYMGHQNVKTVGGVKRFYFKDGSAIIGLSAGECLDIRYDINGDKRPNLVGYDQYNFLMCFDDTNRTLYFGNKNIFFGTYGESISGVGSTREEMVTRCKNRALSCSRLLQNDLWEYKSDYPYKF